jgi:hypothetical protein
VDLEEATGALRRVDVTQIADADLSACGTELWFEGPTRASPGDTFDPDSKSSAIAKIDAVSRGAVRLADGKARALLDAHKSGNALGRAKRWIGEAVRDATREQSKQLQISGRGEIPAGRAPRLPASDPASTRDGHNQPAPTGLLDAGITIASGRVCRPPNAFTNLFEIFLLLISFGTRAPSARWSRTTARLRADRDHGDDLARRGRPTQLLPGRTPTQAARLPGSRTRRWSAETRFGRSACSLFAASTTVTSPAASTASMTR